MTGYCHSCGHDKPLDNQTKYCDPCYKSIAEQTAANHKRGMFVFDLQEPMFERAEYDPPESWQEADAHPKG